MTEGFEGGEGPWGGVEEGYVWAVDFVPAEGVEVDTERLHVEWSVRGVGYAIDAEESGGDGVDEGGD